MTKAIRGCQRRIQRGYPNLPTRSGPRAEVMQIDLEKVAVPFEEVRRVRPKQAFNLYSVLYQFPLPLVEGEADPSTRDGQISTFCARHLGHTLSRASISIILLHCDFCCAAFAMMAGNLFLQYLCTCPKFG